jgi:hypothetical protein
MRWESNEKERKMKTKKEKATNKRNKTKATNKRNKTKPTMTTMKMNKYTNPHRFHRTHIGYASL